MVKKNTNFIQKFYLVLIFIFLYAPIVTLMFFSFNKSKSMANWSGFTLDWYVELFKNENLMSALYYTVLVAVLSSIISTIIGTISAIGIHHMKNNFTKKALLNINQLPVLNPDIYSYMNIHIRLYSTQVLLLQMPSHKE